MLEYPDTVYGSGSVDGVVDPLPILRITWPNVIYHVAMIGYRESPGNGRAGSTYRVRMGQGSIAIKRDRLPGKK